MLTPEQIKAREGLLTASRMNILMSGDEAEIYALWQEVLGDPLHVPENLDGEWAVQLGSATEQLNLDWFARKHGEVIRRGEVVRAAKPDWAACTLDGWSVKHDCPIECKHVGGREPLEAIINRYQPQMQWQMMVMDAEPCALSVIMGANQPVVEFIPRDQAYIDILLQRAHEFMEHVFNLTPPVVLPSVPPPVIPSREYDMNGQNSWANSATDWLSNIKGKRIAERAEKELKGMVPPDALRCFGYKVQIQRLRNGNLKLTEQEQPK